MLESARGAAAISDRWWRAELYRLDARRHRGAAAAALLRQAADIAEQQGAMALVRRAADDLAERGLATGTEWRTVRERQAGLASWQRRADAAAARVRGAR